MPLILDPTSERTPAARERVARLEGGVSGRRLALLDISKPRGDIFLDQLERALKERGAIVSRYRKPTYTKPAPLDLREQIAAVNEAVIEALAD